MTEAITGEHHSAVARAPFELERLLDAERAIRFASESVAQWWQELSRIAQVAVTRQELDDLFREALHLMARALDADEVSFLVPNEHGDELVARISTGLTPEISLGLGIRIGQGMAGRVLATREATLISDLSLIELASPALEDHSYRSVVAVPVLSGERLLGVLHAGSTNLDHFSPTTIEVLELLAERLASALDRVQLFETERRAREQAEEIATRLARIENATSALASCSTTPEVSSTLLRLMTGNGPPVKAIAWLFRGQELVEHELGGDGVVREEPADHRSSLLASVSRLGKPYYVANSSRIEGTEAVEELPIAGDHCCVVLPLRAGGRILGALYVGSNDVSELDEDERELLLIIADQAAQALDRARLSENQSRLLEINTFISRTARVLAEAESSGLGATLDRLAELALPVLGDICLIDVLISEHQLARVVARHRDLFGQHLVDRLRTEFPPHFDGDHPAIEVIRSGQPRWARHMDEHFMRSTTRDDEHFALTTELGFRSYIAVPLLTAEGTLGCLTFVSCSGSYTPADVELAETLAQHAAVVVENARRYESTFRTSQILQESLLPRALPVTPGVVIESRYLASTRGLDVGGDFYDVVALPGGRLSFMIGDIEGHDRDAAALMGQFRSAARALLSQMPGPASLIRAMRHGWKVLGLDRTATALFGEMDPSTGQLVMASAGHLPPLIVSDRSARYVKVEPTTPFGAPSTSVHEWSGHLQPGETLLLYTDGTVDEGVAGPEAGMRRIREAAASAGATPRAICDRVIESLHEERTDDVALLAIQRTFAELKFDLVTVETR
jgi:GAF domain-containing protein